MRTNLKEKQAQIIEEKELSQLLVPELLEDRIAFNWSMKPKNNWAGYSMEYLVGLTQEIALMIGVTNDHAEILRIIFADNTKYRGKSFLAGTIPEYSGRFNYLAKCGIIVNRSRTNYNIINKNSKETKKKSKTLNYQAVILQKPIEWIVWAITEELYHSKLFFMAKTEQQNQQIDARFKKIIKRKRGISEIDYENDYQEMIVARICLRILAKLIPVRADYYNRLYAKSLNDGIRPFPYVGNIIDETFIS